MRHVLTALLACSIAACSTVGSSPEATVEPAEATRQPRQPPQDGYAQQRQTMVETIERQGIESRPVLQAMRAVPRHDFVSERYLDQAYENHPLPIGFGQTISQPYIVGLMTEHLEVEAGDKVLEIGTGSGYQAAVLAELGTEVYSVEIIGELAEQAEDRLARLGYDRVQVRHADGYFGWEQHAPYDAVIVTAAPDHVPQPLVNQLKIGAHLLIPVGPPGGYQELWQVTRASEDEVESVSLGGVRFVPLVREEE